MNYENLIEQAEIHYNAHEHPQAIDYATQAIEADPAMADGYYWHGVTYRVIGDHENMNKDADTLLKCTPTTALHFAYRGWAYNVKGNYEQEAIAECKKAIAQDVSEKKAYYYRAWAYDDLNDYDSAINDCNEAIKIDSEYASAYNLRGNLYKKQGSLEQAIADYDKAIELDPKFTIARNNRLNAYHAKDENLAMKLVDIRKNREYMDELKLNIDKVIPFLGAGTSKPYGFFTWSELLIKLLDMCCDIHEVPPETKEKINEYIKTVQYLNAANELDKIFSSISSAVAYLIERAVEANPIKNINKRSILSEYLHLFPNKKYLTTNYDTVIQDILESQGLYVNDLYPTSGLNLPIKRRKRNIKRDFDNDIFSWLDRQDKDTSEVYYLHGVYDDPPTIIISEYQYDDHYGMTNSDIMYKLRRYLPSEIFNIYHNSIFLYIGCGMIAKEDRILKIIGEFYGVLRNTHPSYALLNINEIANTKVLYENWRDQSEEEQEKLNTALKKKEAELVDMNVRVIWYSAPNNSVDGHESAKRQLFKYILSETRERVEETKKEKQRFEAEKAKQEVAMKKQEEEKLRAELEKTPWGEDTDDLKTTTTKENGKKAILTEKEWKQIEKFFKDQILIKEGPQTKRKIEFPMYNDKNEIYQMYIVSEEGNFYLSDDGTTYVELDKIFELKEPDVIKNLVAILRQYGCRKQQGTNAFIIDCTLQDITIKMSCLIQAISFMLNMKIFYV